MTRASALLAAAALLVVAACRPRSRDVGPGGSVRPAVVPAPTATIVAAAVTPATASVEPSSPSSSAANGAAPLLLHVPRAPRAIVPSTRFDVPTWGSAVSTQTLTDAHGEGAVPVSEARFLWRGGFLYLLFYAGDLDLQIRATRHDGPVWKDDSFTIASFEPGEKARMITVSATGVVADGICPRGAAALDDARCDLRWTSGTRTAADWDGTINKLGDFDEEWNVQAAIPLRSLTSAELAPGARIELSLERCEIAYDGRRACGAWGTAAKPAELVLD